MRDVLPDIDRWQAQGQAIALATVVETWGSAPRGLGSKMALTADGQIAGSVSGGCVEGAVIEAGAQVLKSGTPQLLHFGVADETAWEVGLACGGSIDVFVHRLDAASYAAVREEIVADHPAARIVVVGGPVDIVGHELLVREDGSVHGAVASELDEELVRAAHAALSDQRSRRVTLPAPRAEAVEAFVDVLLPAPTIIVVGGVHIAIALTAIAKTLGYRTIVVDPRRAFGSEARFPHVDRLIQAWPDEALAEIGLTSSTAVAMLTHDPKLDDPGLMIALPSEAFYIGALGSVKTQEKRRQRLLAAGLSATHIDRLHGPIGIDLGGRSPEEIALAVMAEIVAARNGWERNRSA